MAFRHLTTERLVLVVATLILASGLVASAWVVTSASMADRPQVDADVGERYDSIQGLEATRTTTIERNGTVASNRTYAVQLRPGTDEHRLSLVDGSTTRYDLRVSNGSSLWLFDRNDASVTRISLASPSRDSTQGDRIERLFARLNATGQAGHASDSPPTVEPLPVVPQSSPAQPAATSGDERGPFTVTYDGIERVDDRDAHVLHVEPADHAVNASYEQTLWVDSEWFYPLKQRTAWSDDGERTVITTSYGDVQFNPGLDDATFQPDFPPNTTVRAADTPETTHYRQIDALEAETDVSIPDPDVPPSYELTYASQTEGQVHGVDLRYANSTSGLTVSKYNFTYSADDGDEQVRIDGEPGQLTYGPTVMLSWNCADYRYTIRSQGVSTDQLVDIGQSVGCPGTGT